VGYTTGDKSELVLRRRWRIFDMWARIARDCSLPAVLQGSQQSSTSPYEQKSVSGWSITRYKSRARSRNCLPLGKVSEPGQ